MDGLVDGISVPVLILMIVTDVLILALNPLCILALPQATSIQETTKVFLVSLAISDTCLGFITVPPTIVHYGLGYWPFGKIMCKILGAVKNTFFYTSVLALLLITFDRYLAIRFSLKYLRLVTVKRSLIAVCCTLIPCLVITSMSEGLKSPYCSWQDGDERIQSMFLTVIPLMVMFLLYLHILLIAHRHTRYIDTQHQMVNPRDNARPSSGQPSPGRQMSIKSITTVFIITLAVAVSWVPDVIRIIIQNRVSLSNDVHAILDVTLITNSWVNVVIYSLRNKSFRDALSNYTRNKWCKMFPQCKRHPRTQVTFITS